MHSISLKGNFAFIVLLMLLSAQARATDSGTVRGKVSESPSGRALPGVNVQLEGTVLGTSTDSRGTYMLNRVPVGTHTLRVSMIGHQTARLPNVTVTAGDTVYIDCQLQETVLNFDPLIVTSSKMHQELDMTPNSMSVMSSAEIRTRNSLRIDQALEVMPGINFIREQVNIRGSTGFTIGAANRTLLLLDGVPVMASDTGEFNWDLLPVLDVEQIEVVKGASSAIWGTAALGGVINIITKSPTERGKTVVRVSAGEYGQPRYEEWQWTDKPLQFGRVDVSHSRKLGNFGYRLSLGRHVSSGYTDVGDFKRWNLTGKFSYSFKNGSTWTLYSAYNHNLTGFFIGWDDPRKPFQLRPSNVRGSRAEIKMANFYTKYNWVLSPKAALKFRLSYLMTLMGSQFYTSTDFNPAHGWGAEIQGDLLPLHNIVITYGSELKWDTGNTEFFGEHRGYSVGLYAQGELRVHPTLRITPGLRYDRYQLIGGLSQSLLSPRFGVNYRPCEGTVLRASAGSGFRAATIAERYINFENNSIIVEANPQLKAETAWTYDIGCRQYITSNWFCEIGAFRSDFDNLIEVDLRSSAIEFGQDIRVAVQFKNLQKAQIDGLELTTSGRWWRERLGLQATATIMDHKDALSGEPLSYRPRVIAHLNPSLSLGAFELHAEYRYASRIEAVKLFYYDDRVPQKVWNFRLLYHLGNIDVQIAVNNALDYYYTQIERSMGEIRNFTFGITGEF